MTDQEFEAVARELAAAHQQADPGTREVYLDPDPQAAEIRLVEITESVNTTGDVLPYRFELDERRGVPFPSVVVLLSPAEWASCQEGRLALPTGWGKPGDLKKLA